MRILVVEDQASAAEALQLLLESDGHEVVLAATFASASELIQASKPDKSSCYDVALLDLQLPDGDGRDLVAMMRSFCPDTRVFLATGSAVLENHADGLRFEDTTELAKRLGADGCIGKPINYDDLIRLVLE